MVAVIKSKLIHFSLIALLLSLPFERVLTFNIGNYTAKLPYFTSMFLLLVFLYLAVSGSIKIFLDKYDLALFLFVLLSFCSFLWSIDQRRTLIVSAMLLFMALVFFAVRRMAKKENLESYLNIFVWLGVLTSLFGLWQFFGDSYGISTKYTFLAGIYIKDLFGFPRIQSTFFEPGFFANFLLIPIFLSVYKYFKSGRPAYLFALFLTSLAFFLTLSRGGLYSLLISLFLLLVLVTVYNRELIKKIIPALLMVVFAFFLSLASIYFVSSNKGLSNYGKQSVKSSDLVVNGGQASKDALSRSYTISVALKNWKENKWGAGTGAFGMLPEFESVRASGNPFQTVNSLYPEILVEQGIQGLIVFLSFLGLIFVFLIKKAAKRDILYLVFACIFSGMFIQYVSFSTLYLVYVWVFLGLAMRMEPKDNV